MKTKVGIQIIYSFILTLICNAAFGQGQATTMGKDFWLTFGYQSSATLELKFVATVDNTTVKVTFTETGVSSNYILNAGEVKGLDITSYTSNVMNGASTITNKKTIHIEATEGISVYAINQASARTDATAILPVSSYGNEYYQMGYNAGGYTAIMLIAVEDGTTVQIEGNAATTINRGQVYYYVHTGTDLTGYKVTGNKNFAYFIHDYCVNVPTQKGACDGLYEQLMPISSYGNNFLAPVTVMGVERIRVIASQDGTVIGFDPIPPVPNTAEAYYPSIGKYIKYNQTGTVMLNAGQFTELEIRSHTHITSNKPTAVGHYLVGVMHTAIQNNPAINPKRGDPSLTWLPPVEQSVRGVTIVPFVPIGPSVITNHFVTILAPTATKDNTTVEINNGASQALSGGTWVSQTSSGYSVYNMEVDKNASKTYTFRHPNGLLVIAYGNGSYESYGYLAGASARKLDAAFYITNDGERYHYQDANLSVPFDCGSPFTFEAEIQYNLQTSPGHIKWYVDGVEETSAQDRLTWTQPYLSGGNHTVKLAITDEYGEVEELETTLNVECATDMSPKTATIYEGDTQEMTITLSGIAPTNIVFNLSVYTGTTAQASDYSFPATATIAAGSDEVRFNVVAQLDNIINEPDELLVLRAYNSEYGELFSNITIKDKSTTAQKTLTLSANPIEINEPHTGYTTTPNGSVLTLSLPSSITTDTIIRVGLAYAGTAIIDTDYTLSTTAAKTYIEIPQGGSSASFTLTAKEDNLYEGAETVVITPTAPAGHTMSTASVTVTINDKTPSAIVVATILDAEESATASVTGKFRIRFSKTEVTTKKPITVVYKLTGTANDGTAYDLINPTQAIIPLDQSYVDVEVKPKNNFVVEGARKVNIELLSVTD